MPLIQDIYTLSPGTIIELYEVDTTGIDSPGTVYRFHDGMNEFKTDVYWKGSAPDNKYSAFPVEVTGFSESTQGSLPKPMLKIANVDGIIGSLNRSLNDMVGAKVTRIRTLAKYLDAVNFTDGNALADPTQSFPDDVFYINRRVSENRVFVEYELVSIFDLEGIKLPRRQIIQNVCTWKYKGISLGDSYGCPYAGADVADAQDRLTTDVNYAGADVCGKKISSCKLRFPAVSGVQPTLPYGGFPGAGLF